MIHNTIADNHAIRGGGLLVSNKSKDGILMNTIVWGNTADEENPGIMYAASGNLHVYHSDIQDDWPGTNENISKDPAFMTTNPLKPYSLLNISPCIGAGTAELTINGVHCTCLPYDIMGDPRPQPDGSDPDMGAYENFLDKPWNSVNSKEHLDIRKYHLYQNSPNPFNPTTTIEYDLAKSGNVKLVITIYSVVTFAPFWTHDEGQGIILLCGMARMNSALPRQPACTFAGWRQGILPQAPDKAL